VVENFRALLAEKLELTRPGSDGDQRSMWPNSEVQDILLDLWNALTADEMAEVELQPVG